MHSSPMLTSHDDARVGMMHQRSSGIMITNEHSIFLFKKRRNCRTLSKFQYLGHIENLICNREEDLELINEHTAAVILETIQGANGFVLPKNDYLKHVRERCNETGALLILDEIQSGFGRTGKFFGFGHFEVVPDILVVGKALGGGMPIGAFISSNEIMAVLRRNPMLGHITTFGGHPVSAAAALAHLKLLHATKVTDTIAGKEARFRAGLAHPAVKAVTGKGLMLAAHLESAELAQEVVKRAMEKGLILFWLLFRGNALRITPPLVITDEQINRACRVIRECLDELTG